MVIGEVIYNNLWAEILGYSGDELASDIETRKKLIHPEDINKVEQAIRDLKVLDRFQFERLGYFCIDPYTTKENLIIHLP